MRSHAFPHLICRVLLVLSGFFLAFSQQAFASTTIQVAAAATLRFAMADLVHAYQHATGRKVQVAYGSSGNFYSQIQQGAPYDIFLAANESYVTRLAHTGKVPNTGTVYALGQLALIVPKHSSLHLSDNLSDLPAALKDGRLRRFAIANPSVAPYGQRAKETLQHMGIWQAIQPRLVFGENVAQAMQFALSGSAQGGLVALSLALAPEVATQSRYVVVPDSWHKPLKQRMVLIHPERPPAVWFYDYLQSKQAATIFTRYGYKVPN